MSCSVFRGEGGGVRVSWVPYQRLFHREFIELITKSGFEVIAHVLGTCLLKGWAVDPLNTLAQFGSNVSELP